jgi:hypothetical protein
MITTFINPVVNPDAKLGIGAFNDTDPVQLWGDSSEADFELVIRSVYKQVLGNAHVMESERLVVPESQLKQGEITVREFVRRVAQSELYRSRFFEDCSRYRTIELNFKHLLGRAPESYGEMVYHSQLLDQVGFDAEINGYIDSDEYQDAFGENIVPYYRGCKTQMGRKMVGFTHLLQLWRGASSSDKDLTNNNRARLTRSLIRSLSYGQPKLRDANDIIAEALKLKSQPRQGEQTFEAPVAQAELALQQKLQEQAALIATLQQQLAGLRSLASVGFSTSSQWGSSSAGESGSSASPSYAASASSNPLQQQVDQQATLISNLQGQLAEARALAAIGEARVNKWHRRF